MKGKLLIVVMVGILGLNLAGCTQNAEESTNQSEIQYEQKEAAEVITVNLNNNTEGIKILGERNLSSASQINCDWSCSGVEFEVETSGGQMVFRAGADGDSCYFRAYVDGEAWNNGETPYYKVNTNDSTIVLEDIPEGVHTIRLVKVTGYTIARAQLYSVTFRGTINTNAPQDRDMYIEFVGDSICCGYSVASADGKTTDGSYAAQDGTMAYPYLIANELNADYSVMALSGQGLLIGSPGIERGYRYESWSRNPAALYEPERKADVVVVNVGTNDFGNKDKDEYGITEDKFEQAYINLLKSIRSSNGEECKIYCVYGVMNDTFQAQIERACAYMGGEQEGIYACLLQPQTEDGQHPNAEQNKQYAEQLVEFIQNN